MKKSLVLLAVLLNVLCFSSKAQNNRSYGEIIAIWDTIDFDSPGSYIHIDTSVQNIWQIGHPHKIFFDSAYSAQKAIVTDTINNYPAKNLSYFDLYIGTFNNQWYPNDIFISFWHKFDTDTLKDGGFITVSWDKGLTWMNIIKDTVYGVVNPGTYSGNFFNNFNLYNTTDLLFNGEYGFSGHSNQWIYTAIGWNILPVKYFTPPDTMIVRFNFISDSIDNPKEGWIIDDIRLYSIDVGGGIKELFGDKSLSFSPNPFNTSTQITLDKPYHNISLSVYDIQGKLMLQKQYAEKSQIQLDREGLNNGMYFLKLRLDDKLIETGKIVVSE